MSGEHVRVSTSSSTYSAAEAACEALATGCPRIATQLLSITYFAAAAAAIGPTNGRYKVQGQYDGNDFLDLDGNIMDLTTVCPSDFTCTGTPAANNNLMFRLLSTPLLVGSDADTTPRFAASVGFVGKP